MERTPTKIIIIVLFVLTLCAGIFSVRKNFFLQRTTEVQIGSQTLQVEVARTAAEKELGLGNRKELGSDGMLFVFTPPSRPTFWMKGMQFDLDFIWIKDATVVDLHQDVKAPIDQQAVSPLPTYTPTQPINFMLEVPAGFIEQHNIKIGDTVDIR